MNDQLQLHQMSNDLDQAHARFNALAAVAGREMPKFLKRGYAVPFTIGIAAFGAALEARYGATSTITNALIATAAYTVGMIAGENADLREAVYCVATGLGSAAASVGTYDKVTQMIKDRVAPPPPAMVAGTAV